MAGKSLSIVIAVGLIIVVAFAIFANQSMKRIDQLEKRLAQVESGIAQPVAVPAVRWLQPSQRVTPKATIPNRLDSGVPRNWRGFEFNGQNVYIVPCGSNGSEWVAKRR